MRLFIKLLMSAVVHLICFFMVLFADRKVLSPPCAEIYYIMVRPECIFFVYPILVNIIVSLIYKVKPLETDKEKKYFLSVTTLFTVIMLLLWI